MYILFKYEGSSNDKYTYGDIYGIYQGKWQYIHSLDEWMILSSLNKEYIFKQCSSEMPDKQILNDFIPFSILVYADNDNQRQFNIDFIPKQQLLVMKDLINLNQVDRILSITVNTIEINGLIYILVTNGIKNDNNKYIYYTYKFNDDNNILLNQWIPVLESDRENHIFLNADKNFGTLTNRKLFTISAEEINKLFTNINESKLGFAFLYVPLGENAQIKVTDIDITVDAKGIWESTQAGVDYIYNYPDNSHINITIKKKGKYKINYYV